MAKLTIIFGPGGSGKSFLCDKLRQDTRATVFKDATLVNILDDQRAGHGRLTELVDRVLRGENGVMDESHLSTSGFRATFKRFCDDFLKGVEMEWIFFRKNELACINNLYKDATDSELSKRRDDHGRCNAVKNQLKDYSYDDARSFPGFREVDVVDSCGWFKTREEAFKWLDSTVK